MSASVAKFKLDEKANIRTITDIHTRLYSALTENDTVELDTDACKEADLSAIQLIESACIHARTAGKEFRLSGPLAAPVEAVLARAGFLENASDADRRFWFNEGVE